MFVRSIIRFRDAGFARLNVVEAEAAGLVTVTK